MKDLKVGDEVWYFGFGFYRTGKTWGTRRPKKLLVGNKELRERTTWKHTDGSAKMYQEHASWIEFKDEKGNLHSAHWEDSLDTCYENYYKTLEEAIEGHDAKIRNEIDLARYEYEERVKLLTKKLIKK